MTKKQLDTLWADISHFFQRWWNFVIICCIGVGMNLKEIFTPHKKIDLKNIPLKSGEIAVITGGGRGIGLQIVKQLLIFDMTVVIGCKNPSQVQKEVEKLRNSGGFGGSTQILPLDLASFHSVRNFASKIKEKYSEVHLLINNGGIMLTPFKMTGDGHESQFQVNYLSHFLLTNLLLPPLIAGGRDGKKSRIVNVSSVAHFGGQINFQNVTGTKMYCETMAYMSSKLMQVINTKDLNRRLEEKGLLVGVYAVHPGMVFTGLWTSVWIVNVFGWLFELLYKSPEQGADGVIFAAISSNLEGESGHYFANCRKNRAHSLVESAQAQKELWTLSCKLTKFNEDVALGL